MPFLSCLLLLVMAWPAIAADKPKRAKNVILFIADAGGIPILNAASIYGYNAPQKLFVQNWPYMGLSNTATASQWVTDSAAGMTAIVTGRKTHNGVISQGPDTIRGEKDGMPLKTILEYAEERGLSTGVLSDVTITDATPAACYSHANNRSKFGEIILELFTPRFGDGVDVLIGPGRKPIYTAVKMLDQDLDAVAKKHNRPIYASLNEVPAHAQRPLVISGEPVDLPAAAKKAVQILSKNAKGYFLMIESDAHTDKPVQGLSHLVAFDNLIRELSDMVNREDTLLLFVADHSFELRVNGGKIGEPLLKGVEEWEKQTQGKKGVSMRLPNVSMDNHHTGEEVLATAMGPGAERVHGFFPNTYLFEVMMQAYGWTSGPPARGKSLPAAERLKPREARRLGSE